MRAMPACMFLALTISAAWPVGVVGRQGQLPAPPQEPRVRYASTRDVLDRYFKGDYAEALTGPPALARFVFTDAERWVASGDARALERRAMAAALFALEYAGARPALLPALLTWARELLARQPPRAAEADWLRASIALAEGKDRWVFLIRGVSGRAVGGKSVAPVGQIRFARLRYPDDPYFQMAEAVGIDRAVYRPLDRLSAPPAQSSTEWDSIRAELVESVGPAAAERAAALERAAGLLDRLTSHATLGAEANLRLGYVRLRQGQSDAALACFDRVIALTNRPFYRYLGHLFSGWVLGAAGRVDEAVTSYRAALKFVPRAQSATALLVALLTRHDRLADAEAAAEDFLSDHDLPTDPFRAYFMGDFEAYPDLVRRLRETIQ